MLLSTFTSNRNNNFNLIRFTAAILVLFSHSFAIIYGTGNAEPLKSTINMTWGTIAVDIFFITSGFLITRSYFSKKSIFTFLKARALRIYPALIISIIFCVFIVGLWFTTLNVYDYFSHPQTHRFIMKNSTLLFGHESSLPKVFENAPLKHPINGSLWTLPYEIKMYLLITLILGISLKASKYVNFITPKTTILFLALISTALHFYNHYFHIINGEFLRLFQLFFTGAAFYTWRNKITLSFKIFLVSFSLLLLSTLNINAYFILYTLSLPYLILYIAYVPEGKIRNFNRLGDYSYGVYIYAFPIQQSLIASAPKISTPLLFSFSVIITLALATMSWHFIEKPMLNFKKS